MQDCEHLREREPRILVSSPSVQCAELWLNGQNDTFIAQHIFTAALAMINWYGNDFSLATHEAKVTGY